MGNLQKEPFLNVRDYLGIVDRLILSFDFQNLRNVQVNESVEHPRAPFWLPLVSTFPFLKVIAYLTFNTTVSFALILCKGNNSTCIPFLKLSHFTF